MNKAFYGLDYDSSHYPPPPSFSRTLDITFSLASNTVKAQVSSTLDSAPAHTHTLLHICLANQEISFSLLLDVTYSEQ